MIVHLQHFQPEHFFEPIRMRLERFYLLKHRFYQLWSQGKLSLDMLRGYAKQYYHLEKALPLFLECLVVRAPDQWKDAILANLKDERGDSERTAHVDLWLHFTGGLGLSTEEVIQSQALDSTQGTINTFLQLCRFEPCLKAIAALFAYEAQITDVAQSKIEGLRKFYRIDEDATQFFVEHASVDPQHAQVWWNMLVQYQDDAVHRSSIFDGVEVGARALWRFLDGVEVAFLH